MTRLLRRYVLCAALVATWLVSAEAHAQRVTAVNLDKSAITFVARQMNVPSDGKFGKFAMQLAVRPGQTEREPGAIGGGPGQHRYRQRRGKR